DFMGLLQADRRVQRRGDGGERKGFRAGELAERLVRAREHGRPQVRARLLDLCFPIHRLTSARAGGDASPVTRSCASRAMDADGPALPRSPPEPTPATGRSL